MPNRSVSQGAARDKSGMERFIARVRGTTYDRVAVLRIVGAYTVLGLLWIFFSDTIAGRLVQEGRVLTLISLYKGFGFILATAALLFFLLRSYLKQLHEKIVAIEELNLLRNRFITILSHQLRTPVTSINWNLEMLLKGDFGKMQEAQETFLRGTYDASMRLMRRVHELLVAIDIEEGRVLIARDEFSLESMCKGVIGEHEQQARLKHILLVYAGGGEHIPALMGDGEKIRSVVHIMIENALTYTPDGGSVTVTLSRIGSMARFAVLDSGVGVPAAEQHRIFSRFFRASNAAVMQPDSSGVGLFVAKYFIEQHGGSIGFVSTEGKGSTFWFELPIPEESA